MVRRLMLAPLLMCLCSNRVFADEPAKPIAKSDEEKPTKSSKLNVPFDQVVTVQGVVVEGPFKGFEGGPNLRPQRIQGVATQRDIQIRVITDRLPNLKLDWEKTYELVGHVSGSYVGTTEEQERRLKFPIQTTRRYFQEHFVMSSIKKIEPIKFSPREFEDRKALFEGTARDDKQLSILDGDGWTIVVNSKAPWPEKIRGKRVETYGFYKPLKISSWFELTDGHWRLVKLEDQLGRQVKLRGRAWSLNNHWCFRYRGTDLYVENMEKLPGWTGEFHGAPLEILGTLEKANLPAIDQISTKEHPDLKQEYIVRKASWKELDYPLLFPERPLDEDP